MARERAEELVRLVADLYGAGLERVLTSCTRLGASTTTCSAALAADDLVASLLLVHDLHPYDVATRVEQALESVRPYLGTHGGDVELLEVSDGGVVRLRLLGSCDGCASSSVTLKLAVEGAIEAAAPEIIGIEVETPRPSRRRRGLISVDSLWSRLDRGRPRIAGLLAPAAGACRPGAGECGDRWSWSATTVLVCRLGPDLFAFLDRCARCEASLAGRHPGPRLGAAVGDAVLRCPTCRAHFQVRRAGACLDTSAAPDPLPLLIERGGQPRVAVPVPVAA